GEKSIPRCSISFAPDSSPSPSRTRPCTWSRVKGFCCAQAGRAKTSPIASMRRVSVFRNLIATSQGSRGLRRIYGTILPQIGGIATSRQSGSCMYNGAHDLLSCPARAAWGWIGRSQEPEDQVPGVRYWLSTFNFQLFDRSSGFGLAEVQENSYRGTLRLGGGVALSKASMRRTVSGVNR